MPPRRAIGIFAATWMASFRSRAFLDAGVRLLLGHRVHVVLDKIYQADGTSKPSRCGRMAADTSLSFRGSRNRQPRWLRAEVGEARALERRDAPIRIGAQLGREGVHGLQRALHRGAAGGSLRSQEARPRQRNT